MRIALLAAAALLCAAAPSSAATACGTVNGGFEYNIRAVGVSCKEARSTARQWHRKAVAGPVGTTAVGPWSCRSRSIEGMGEHVRVVCRSSDEFVRFNAGP